MEIPYIKPILAIIKQCVNSEDLAGELGNSIKPTPCPDISLCRALSFYFHVMVLDSPLGGSSRTNVKKGLPKEISGHGEDALQYCPAIHYIKLHNITKEDSQYPFYRLYFVNRSATNFLILRQLFFQVALNRTIIYP